ncbi:MAG: glycoside hydrolase family 36 protein, partial [Anaerohalosphaeraceae bacterium]
MDSNRTLWTLVYTEPNDGPLKVTCQATEYQDYPAVEWVIYFDNIGTADTPIIENIQALATTMCCPAVADKTSSSTCWDAAADWQSDSSSTNGPWSYQQGWIGNWAPMSQYDTSTGLQRWSAGESLPYIARNTTVNPVTVDGASVAPGKLVMCCNNGYNSGLPGPGSCPSITWTCPKTGVYDIDIALKNIGAGGNGVQWCLHSGSGVINTGSGNIDNQASDFFHLENQSISQGTQYGITFNSRGDATGDLTEISYAITSVSDIAEINEFTLHYAQGDTGSPSDFQPIQRRLNRNVGFSLAPNKGRSSDTTMPFFNIEQPDHTGRIVAIGWTGQWKAALTRDSGKNLNVQAGMERTHLCLHPGEKIRTPAILMTFWAGDRIHAQNVFRRLIREHYSPRQNGKPADLPLCMSVHGTYSFEATSESNLKDFILKLKQNQCPVDYIWIDAGWYNLNGRNSWVNVGTWEPDQARYPNGMKPVVDYAHSNGYKLVLWFEPERVTKSSWLWNNHPEWIFRQGDDWPLLNLGNPDCLAWVKTTFGDMIGNWGVDVYRQDFNVFPLSAWRNGEAADRQGIHEIKHIMGLYEFWDYLLSRYPNLIIDNCASGGRRIDFETLRRSLVLWRDDHCWVSDSEQCINYGISMWLPWTGRGSVSTAPYDVRSGMGSFMSLAFNVNDNGIWKPANEAILQYKTVRHLFQGDYYLLTPYSLAKDV